MSRRHLMRQGAEERRGCLQQVAMSGSGHQAEMKSYIGE
jgi:hypothetical protein